MSRQMSVARRKNKSSTGSGLMQRGPTRRLATACAATALAATSVLGSRSAGESSTSPEQERPRHDPAAATTAAENESSCSSVEVDEDNQRELAADRSSSPSSPPGYGGSTSSSTNPHQAPSSSGRLKVPKFSSQNLRASSSTSSLFLQMGSDGAAGEANTKNSDGKNSKEPHYDPAHIHTDLEKRLGHSLGYVLRKKSARPDDYYFFEQHEAKHIHPPHDPTDRGHQPVSGRIRTHGYVPFMTHVDEETHSMLQLAEDDTEIHERPYHYAPSASSLRKLDAHHEEVRAMVLTKKDAGENTATAENVPQSTLPEQPRTSDAVEEQRPKQFGKKKNLRPQRTTGSSWMQQTLQSSFPSALSAQEPRDSKIQKTVTEQEINVQVDGMFADSSTTNAYYSSPSSSPESDSEVTLLDIDEGMLRSKYLAEAERENFSWTYKLQSAVSSFLQDIASHFTGHIDLKHLGAKVGELLAPTWSSEEKEDNESLTDELAKTYHGVFSESHKTTPLTDKRDATSQHLGTIFVGRQQQRLNVIFDSGSTNLWLAAAECDSVRCQENKETLYDIHKSGKEATDLCSVDRQACNSIRIEFGSGSLGGPLGTDTLYLAGHKIENQRFALIHEESGSVFDSLKYGGIMGLAFEDMSSPRLKSVITNAIANNVFQGQNIMAFYFTKNPNIRSGAYFGGVNPRVYHGVPVCLDVQKEHYWQTGLKRMGFRFGPHGKTSWVTHPVGGDPPKSIFWDTGTTWNGGPTYMTRHNLDFLHANGGWNSVECSKLHVKTGTEKIPYLVLDLCMDTDCEDIYRVVQPPEQWYVGGGGGLCKPAFMSIDVPPPYGPDIFVTGEIFMRSFFTIFDRGSENGKQSRVCIAKNKTPKELSEADYEQATELSSPRVVHRVFETRHRPDEPYGKDADRDG